MCRREITAGYMPAPEDEEQRSMRQGLRRALTAAAVGCVVLTGCSSTVTGSASPGEGVPTSVSQDDLPLTGAVAGNPIDDAVRNSLADLYTFWQDAYPKFYDDQFQPLKSGVFILDPADFNPDDFPDGVSCGADPADVAQIGPFYCGQPGRPNSDAITIDRAFMTKFSDQYGASLVPVVMAHEFGHAIQDRFGFDGESINQETQADCFSGAWTRWVVDGNADHVAIRSPELDDVLQGYLFLRDPLGTDPTDQGAHGTYFDRVAAYSEGYDGGVAACRDDFGEDRVFTEIETDQNDQNEGNAPYDVAVDYTTQTLAGFYDAVLPSLGKDFAPPQVQAFDGTAPSCGEMGEENRDLGYCADDDTVYYDETDLTKPAYDIGDFAVTTAISLPYALAARDQLGRSTEGEDATLSATCLTGWYEAQIFSGRFPDVTISAGDIDEAVIFLLDYGTTDAVFPNTDLSGFELLESYRAGFLEGGSPCDVGA